MSNLGIVQFEAYYYPKGYNVLKYMNINPSDIKKKSDLIEKLEFSDLANMHFDGAGQINIWEKLDQAIAKNGNVKKPFIAYMAVGFAGLGFDASYSSGVHWAFDTDVSAEMEYFVEDAFPEFLKLFENHPVLSMEYRDREIKLKDYDKVLSITVPTLWSFNASYDGYNNEYDYDVEWIGILDMKKLNKEQCLDE